MKVIDSHAHIYPDKIAERAVENVGAFYGVSMAGKGSAENLLEVTKESPISHFIVHSVALKPELVRPINDFIDQACRTHSEFIGFATMHQDFEDKEAEINRIIDLGLRGVKIHPDSQKVNMDDPRLMELYEIIEGRLPIIVHTGDYRYDYSHPRRMKKILRTFPDMVVDAAHFGGWSVFDVGVEFLLEENCFMDASSSFAFMEKEKAKELINAYGSDRIMYGSDYPMWDPVTELEHMMGLGFSEEILEKLLCKNAESFLGFEV